MSEIRRVIDRLIARSAARPERPAVSHENLERWERLATPEELTRILGRASVGEAA